MGLKIGKKSELFRLVYDEDVTFLINVSGLAEWRIATAKHTRISENRAKEDVTVDQLFDVDPVKDMGAVEAQRIATAKYLLKGWEGDITLKDDDKPVEYSEEMALDLLETHKALVGWIIQKAVDLENESYAAISETLGKSQNDSSTNSNGADAKQTAKGSKKPQA